MRPYSRLSQKRKNKIIQAVSDNRRAKKLRAVAYKGGKCRICPYDRCVGALQFHHLDPKKKDFHISRAGAWAWSRLVKELDKCLLVCANCHAEIHDGMVDLSQHLTAEELSMAARVAEDEGPNILELFEQHIPQ